MSEMENNKPEKRMSSERLYELCRRGSEEGWREASRYVYALLCARGWNLNEFDRQDLTNDTLVYFLNGGLDRVESPKAFKWLLRLQALGKLIGLWRHRRAGPALMDPGSGEHEIPEERYYPGVKARGERDIFTRQALELCAGIMQGLKQECRELLPQYFRYKVMGYGVGQLAKDRGAPLGTVASAVHRCLKKLYDHPQIVQLRGELLEEVV